MKNILAFILLLMSSATLSAQDITNYAFTATSGTYTALSGITTQQIGASADEVVSANNSIGFEFWYMGTRYTSFGVNENGWLNLGTTTANVNANNLSASGTRPVIAPLWDDLKTNASGKIHSQVNGAAPNRVLTVEFLNMQWYWGASTPVISFQVKLYETSGKIEFIYRPETGAVSSVDVKIELFNAIGQSVVSLVNEKQNAGNYNYNINREENRLTNGVYYLIFIIQDKVTTQKLILTK